MKTLNKKDLESIKARAKLSKRAQRMLLESELWFIVDDYKLQLEFSREQILN
jgi:hypothetical protein